MSHTEVYGFHLFASIPQDGNKGKDRLSHLDDRIADSKHAKKDILKTTRDP